jgi:DNA-binding NtrC family response regulator
VPTVLVLEDDAPLRVLTVSILHELGYDTLTAENGAEAYALIAGGWPKVDVLFADIGLRGSMSGLDLAREAAARQPGLSVIYTSGRRPTDGMEALFVKGGVFIQKPYTMQELGDLLRQVLGPSDHSRGMGLGKP